jgi:hypothetical protein
MQVEDEQWVVRNACTQTLDDLANALDRIPEPLGELAEKPWLVTFASEKGMGIAPGQMSWDMLAMALKDGNEDQILAALDIYRVRPIEARKVVPTIFDLSNSMENEMREAAFNALWHLNAAGVELNSYLGM